MSSFRPDPKPARRIVDPEARVEKLQREGGRCRICASTYLVGAHHIVPRSQGGDDVVENLVALCELHHGKLHRATDGTRTELRLRLTAGEVAYVKLKKGAAWLGSRYPMPC